MDKQPSVTSKSFVDWGTGALFGCAWDLFEMYRLDDPDGDRLRAAPAEGIAATGCRRENSYDFVWE